MLTPARVLDEHKTLTLVKGIDSEQAIRLLSVKHDLREYDIRQVVVINTPRLWDQWNPVLLRGKVEEI